MSAELPVSSLMEPGVPNQPTHDDAGIYKDIPVNVLSKDQLHQLWHMLLVHAHKRICSDLHKVANGIPKLL